MYTHTNMHMHMHTNKHTQASPLPAWPPPGSDEVRRREVRASVPRPR